MLNPSLFDSSPVIDFGEELPQPAVKAVDFKLKKRFQGHESRITHLALHPYEECVVTTSDDKTWKIWTLPDGEQKGGGSHLDKVSTADFHPRGILLATGSCDNSVKIWDITSMTLQAGLRDHIGPVNAVSFDDMGEHLLSASLDSTLCLYDINRMQSVCTLRGHDGSVNDMKCIPFSTLVCSCSADKTVALWDIRTKRRVQTFRGHGSICNRVGVVNHNKYHFGPVDGKGDNIASTDADGIVIVWDVRNMKERAKFNVGYGANGVSFDGNGEILAVASDDGSIHMINIETNQQIGTLGQTSRPILDVLFDHFNRFLLSCSTNSMFSLWC